MKALNQLGLISEICVRYGITSLCSQIEFCQKLSTHTHLIDIGVFGRFKAGKSSFLNSLIGAPVLPVGVIPVTSIITRLRYASSQKVTAHFLDKTSMGISMSNLSQYISENGNPNNQKKVSRVEIELPELKNYEGIQFVDTPGLGSVFKHNSTAALDWLPRVGVAIVSIGVDPPLSEQDIELIRDLLKYTPKLTILLTKSDLVSDLERKEIVTFIQGALKRKFNIEFPIYSYSIHSKYSHLKITLEDQLISRLKVNRVDTQHQVLKYKINFLNKQLQEYLLIALRAANQTDLMRLELKTHILGESTVDSMREEIHLLVRDCLERTRSEVLHLLNAHKLILQERLTEELRMKFLEFKQNLWKLNRFYEDWIREAMHKEMSTLSVQQRLNFIKLIDRAQWRLKRAIGAFKDRIAGNLRAALNIEMSKEDFIFEVTEPKSLDLSIGSAFDLKVDLLWFMIPMFLFRSMIERHFLGLIPFEVEKNISRLASQWTEKINVVISQSGTQAIQYVHAEIESIERLLHQSTSKATSIERALEDLKAFSSDLS